ncbi:MAG: ABC transporter ATP-binding protein [Acidimicrobiales bacterium]
MTANRATDRNTDRNTDGPNGGPTGRHGLHAQISVRRSTGSHDQTRNHGGFAVELDLQIEPGHTAALLGPNGAGKSTVVEAIAGLVALDEGSITLGDRALDQPSRSVFIPPEARNIGVVFQDYLLFENLSVLDNVAFGLTATGSGRGEAATVAAQWIEKLGLTGLESRRPSMLSGGQSQRVAIARALAASPSLLLLDEPLAALDVATRNQLRRVLVDHLATFSGPRLLITHDPSDAFVMADSIYVIEQGRCTQHGTVEEIRRRPATPYVAALAGTNFLTGFNDNGTISIDSGPFDLRTSNTTSGPVQAIINPRAISLYETEPQGSPRNSWQTAIEWIEPLGETTRIQLGAPLPLLVDITPAAAAALALVPGRSIWATVKATEVEVFPV